MSEAVKMTDGRGILHIGNLSLQDQRLLIVLGIDGDSQYLDKYSATTVPGKLRLDRSEIEFIQRADKTHDRKMVQKSEVITSCADCVHEFQNTPRGIE